MWEYYQASYSLMEKQFRGERLDFDRTITVLGMNAVLCEGNITIQDLMDKAQAM